MWALITVLMTIGPQPRILATMGGMASGATLYTSRGACEHSVRWLNRHGAPQAESVGGERVLTIECVRVPVPRAARRGNRG